MSRKHIYSQFEDKKLEIEEWDSIVKNLSSGPNLSFCSYLMLEDNRRLLLKEPVDYVGEVLRKRRNCAVLDIGGGDGFFLRFNSHLPFKGVVLDISRIQLELGKHRQGGRAVDFVQADADYLPFRNEVFDVVIACGFLHHCSPKHEIIIGKISSVSKNGGHLIVVEGMAIGPSPSLLSAFFFSFPHYLTIAFGLTCTLVVNRRKLDLFSTRRLAKSDINTLSGDQKAFLYPLYRPQFLALLRRHYKVVNPLYLSWLSAFVLDALVKTPAPIREKLINLLLPPLIVLDKAFSKSILRKYSHIYLVDCEK